MALTPEEIAQAEAMEASAAPAPLNPLRDLSAEDIAALAVADKNNFNIADEFQKQKDLHSDPAVVQKVADAFNQVKQRGFKLEDLPTAGEAAKAVGTAAKGFAGQLWNYANVAGNVVAGAVSELAGAEGLAAGYAENINERLAENIAGTEEAMTGLSQLAGKGVAKAGRATGITKALTDYTPEERVTDLFNEAGRSEVRTERLTGKGEFTKAVTGEEQDLDPERVAELAAGDPFSFYLFGKASALGGKAAGAVVPQAVKTAAASGVKAVERATERAAETVLPKVVGGAVQATGKAVELGAKGAELGGQVASVVGPIAGGIAAATGADVATAGFGGLLSGAGGVALRKVGQRAAPIGQKISDVGRQISGSQAITSAYAQGARDFLQALPGAAGEVAKGTALDVGLAAATAELPQDTQGAVGFGTALGALGGARRVGGRVLSGQLIAPREYGVNRVLPSSGQFPTFDAMHRDSMQAATPGVRARLNAVRQFMEGAAPGADVFLARDAAATERALLDAGVAPETARLWANQEGVLTTSLPGRDGSRRTVAIVRNVEAAPHEAFHAVQDVLGESANQRIDQVIRDAYAAEWQAEGQKYAQRLGADPAVPWQEAILDASGWGDLEAKEKIYRQVHNRLEAETGATPSPALVEQMTRAELGRVMDAALERGQPVEPNQIGERVWRDVLTTEEAAAVADRYIAREIAAENFDAIFKNQGPRLQEGKQVPQILARIVGGVVTALGGDPLSGRVSEFGQVPLKTPVVEAVRGAATVPDVEIRTTPTPSVRPTAPAGSPEHAVEAAQEARAIAEEAPNTPPVGGTRTQRELLGEIAEAIAVQGGVKINYRSAPGEPAAAVTSNRAARRAIIETFRTMPEAARALWEKTFFPERVIRTRGGKLQIQGWAPEVFAANAHKLANFLADTPGADLLSPYPIDAATRTFTPEGWQQLYADTQTFVQNQVRGATGSGEPLVVPRSVTEAGGFAPATRPGAVALDQGRADFINMLFNFKLPETPRIQTGRRPLNVQGQDVSAATIEGRIEVPARPRGEFTGAEAARQGIEGRQILEVNPLRNQVETLAQSAGKSPPSFIEAIQKLNMDRIVEVEGAPEAPQFRGNTLTLTAGFQPEQRWRVTGQLRGQKHEITVTASDIAAARKQGEAQGMRVASVENADKMTNAMFQPATARGRQLEEKGFEIRHTGGPANPSVVLLRDGVPVADIQAVRESPTEADIRFISVDPKFRGQKLSEVLYREIGQRLQNEGVDNVTGMIVDPRALHNRSKVFPDTQIENVIENRGDTAFEVRSRIAPDAQFLPAPAEILALSPEEFSSTTKAFKGSYGGGLTGLAFEMGARATPELLTELRAAHATAQELIAKAKANKDIDAMFAETGRSQFFREAIEAATGTGPSEGFIRKHYDPNFTSPLKEQPTAQAQPKAAEEIRDLAKGYATRAGIPYEPKLKTATPDTDLLKRVSDFYESAETAPNDAAVQDSYNALANETIDQYNAIVDAGYVLEPWDGKGEPYANSAAMVADVRDNKHLYYFRTKEGFGQEGDAPSQNAMLEDSGVVINGEPVPVNDLFRAVHDFFGHAKEGHQFGPKGEFNAWGTHAEMFSDAAQGALAAETLAQNAFVNFGPHMRTDTGAIRQQGDEGFLPLRDRPFAEQKNVVVPKELIDEARAQFAPNRRSAGAAKEEIEKAFSGASLRLVGSVERVGKGKDIDFVVDHAGESLEAQLGDFYDNAAPVLRERGWKVSDDPVEAAQPEQGWMVGARTPKGETVDLFFTAPSENPSGQFAPRKKKVADKYELKPGSGGFSKAWILPSGEPVQLGGTWHHQWLSENPDVATKYNLDVPAFEGGDTEGVREGALKAGFARVNYSANNGTLTVEARARDWRKVKGAVERMVESNLDGVDNMRVTLLDETATKTVDSLSAKLFNYDDAEKLQHLPFITEGEIRGQFQPSPAGELGLDVTPDNRRVQRNIRAQITKSREQYPEALPLEYKQDETGAFRTDAKGKPIPAAITYDLGATPLAKQAVKGKRTDEAKDAAIDRAYADGIKATYKEAAKNPAVAAGANWYSLARTKLSKLFGAETKFFTELLGATSAQTDVATNFRNSVEAYNNFKQGKYDAQIQKYREGKALWEEGDLGLEPGELSLADVLAEADLGPEPTRAAFMEWWIEKHNLKPRKSNGKLFGANSNAVLKVLDGSWRAEVQGPKTPNFANNLSGDSFEATIDIWAARLLRRLGNEGNERRWRILPKNEVGVTDNDFFIGQRAFRLAGDELGVSPDSLQAILWFAEKDYWDKRGWTDKAGAKKSDFNEFLDVTERGYSEKLKGPGKVVIDEASLKKESEPADKDQLDFALE